MSEKRLDYKPQIGYTSDYSSIDGGRSRGGVDIMISSQSNREPLDTSTIPSIKDNLDYLDIIINYLPTGLSRALREVYEPVRDIYYNNLIDKIIDPNLKPPEIIIKPTIPDITIKDPDTPEDDDIPEGEEIHPIILRPINFNDPDDPNPPGDVEDPYENDTIHPIILLPIQEEEKVPIDVYHNQTKYSITTDDVALLPTKRDAEYDRFYVQKGSSFSLYKEQTHQQCFRTSQV